jgi:hypothetical protein
MDYTGTKCNVCHVGTYQETSIYDDWDGTLHCDNCKNRIYRYGEKWHLEHAIRMAKLEIKWARERIKATTELEKRKIESEKRGIKELQERLKRLEK